MCMKSLKPLGPPGANERLAVFTSRERGATLDRGEPWWAVLQRDPELAEAWSGAAQAYDHGFTRLLRATLGPLADDPMVMAVAATAVGPPLHYALRGAGSPAHLR